MTDCILFYRIRSTLRRANDEILKSDGDWDKWGRMTWTSRIRCDCAYNLQISW